ncbi:MAG: right-handed parallel beta-helix repeat-containing protein, partial [Armatimonadetes bacterium]|nr:right-handed parallel beta-helix repeat-containing protein [Armatimonadota bacterium]
MSASAQTLTWHVSLKGNDAWSGQLAEPNADGTDGPLATLAAAVEASRKHAGGARRILLGPGRHTVEKMVALGPGDSELTIQGSGAGETTVYGGRSIAGWRRSGDKFWVADVPEVKEGKWDFRALVVNDRLCPRARYPETGRLTHESEFPVRWMSSAGGGWERKPTQQELTTMRYKAGDIGPWLSARNAEVTVYHMWDESMIGLTAHDSATRALTFSSPSGHPPGAFGVKTYVVWNVKEGMTRPGQWYLDRDAGQIVYWPLEREDVSAALVVAPTVESLIEIQGKPDSRVRNVAVRDLTLSTTTTPCKAGGFGASNYRGAVQIGTCEGIQVTDVEITNTAGHAIREWGTKGLTVRNCRLHHLGAGGVRAGGGSGIIEGNQIHHVGMVYPSAIALSAGGPEKYEIRRNEIHDTPYSGMGIGGTGTVIEENLLYRCMQELHDGAAIYVSGAKGNILRRNVVRDIVKVGEGYGVSSYYLDEKCRDCLVEQNVSIGVGRPTHNHMTLNCTVRDNVFINDGDMDLSFARSSGFRVTGNTFHLNGKLSVGDPDAIAEWSGNLIVQSGDVAPA